jgi:hypothetical protein
MLQSLAWCNIGLDDSDIVAKAEALACGTAGSLHEEKLTPAITTTATTAAKSRFALYS